VGVVLTANRFGYLAAIDLHKAGVKVEAVIDLRNEDTDSPGAALKTAGIQLHRGHAITLVLPSAGKRGIRGVQVTPLDASGQPKQTGSFEIPCDGLAMSVGFAPADGLFYQGGGRMGWSEDLQQFIPTSAPAGLFAAGRVNGVYGFEQGSRRWPPRGISGGCVPWQVGRANPRRPRAPQVVTDSCLSHLSSPNDEMLCRS